VAADGLVALLAPRHRPAPRAPLERERVSAVAVPELHPERAHRRQRQLAADRDDPVVVAAAVSVVVVVAECATTPAPTTRRF
jgi:hypothetical protein